MIIVNTRFLVAYALSICAAVVTTNAAELFTRSTLDVELPISTTLEVLKPSSFDASQKYPLIVYLHGFCLADEAQQKYSFTASRESPGGGGMRQQTLTQIGIRERINEENFLYLPLDAPHKTRSCALCNIASENDNYLADRLTSNWINSTMSRIGPEFQCAAWAGSDACCNREQAKDLKANNDIEYIIEAIEKVKENFPNVDSSRIYVFGIATGGFMASRIACEAPAFFTAIASFAGATFHDESKCKPKEATNFLGIHGTGDTVVPIEGGKNIDGVLFPSFEKSFDILSKAYACKKKNTGKKFTLSTEATATQRRMATTVDVDVTNYDSCNEGVTLEQWRIDGTDHFLEEKTSLELFSRTVSWLLKQKKKGDSMMMDDAGAIEKQSGSDDDVIHKIEFGIVNPLK